MELAQHWDEVRTVVGNGQRSSIHCTIASVSPDGCPHITPVGTVFLRDDCTGYYFDQYTQHLARNVEQDPRVCLMAVNSGALFWFRSLLAGRFSSAPGVRLYGTVGLRRAATPDELKAVRKRVGLARHLQGGRLLWSQFHAVRDITFTHFAPVTYPGMPDDLWQQGVSNTSSKRAPGGAA